MCSHMSKIVQEHQIRVKLIALHDDLRVKSTDATRLMENLHLIPVKSENIIARMNVETKALRE